MVSKSTIDRACGVLTHHGFLFSMTPILSVLGVLMAAVLGTALAWSDPSFFSP